MNKKKLFSAVFPSVFVFSLLLGAATFVSKFSADSQTSSARRSVYPHTHSAKVYGEDGEWDGSAYFNENTEVEIGRDYFSTDFSSLNSTDVSKSATLKFNSTRLKGWAPSNEVAFVIIDDPDYSGDESNPSMSGKTDPVFHGYTVEMRNATIKIEKFKLDDKGKAVIDETWTDLFVPATLTYGKTFKISNDLIKAGSIEFDFDLAAYEAASAEDKVKIEAKYPNYIVLPKEIGAIEAGAITNIPPFVTVRSDAEDKPSDWANGFVQFADGNQHIQWGYQYLQKGTDVDTKKNTDEGKNVSQSTGLKENYYGRLEHPMHAGYIHAVMDDPDWTGDYANPTRTGGTAPYHMGAFLQKVELNEANIYLPSVVTYGDVEGAINSIGTGAVTFPATDFDTYKHFCPIHNVRLATDEDKAAHAEEHPECRLKVTSLVSYKTYYDATDHKVISATDVEEAEAKGHTVEIIYNKDYKGPVQSIYIPEDIPMIAKETFVNVPREITVRCEPVEAAKPAGWADGFESYANIEWGVNYPVSKTVAASDVDKEIRLSNDPTTYIAGYKYQKQDTYYCEVCGRFLSEEERHDHEHPVVEIIDKIPEFNEPIVVEYDIRKADNTIRKVWHEMPLKSEEETASSTSSYYDPVRSSTETRYFDILPEEGEEFIPESVVIHNIYRAKTIKVRGNVVDPTTQKVVEKVLTYTIPDTSVRFKSVANKRYKTEINIESLVSYEFNGLSKFGSYSMVSMSMDRTGDEFWKTHIDPSTYDTVKDKLANGTYRIRYALYNMTSSYYRVTYVSNKTGLEVTKTVAVDTPNPHYPLESKTGNKVNFLFKNGDIADDFSLSNLREFRLISLTVNIHIWDNDNSIIVNKTSILTHFGAIRVMPYSADGAGIFDVLLFIIVFLLIASALYAAGSVALFFFLRNKFKNDEFRRIRPKAYIKSAIVGYLGYFVIIFTILFIAFRLGRFSNFLAVHNPLDVFIIIPGILALVFVGYFVKFMVSKHKSNKERRRALKLKLNEDVASDGTN